MHIDYIVSFVETVKHKSISKASNKLQISHPALSKQIRKVEEYFGVTLFQRSTSGVQLTEEGKTLLTRIQPLIKELESIREDLIRIHESKRTFTIGALPTVASYYLPPKILHMEQDKVKINLLIRNHSIELFELLKLGTIDCAIIEQNGHQKYLWSRELYREPLYVVLLDSHPLSKKTSLVLEDICQEPFVLHPVECSIRKKVTQLFQLIEKDIHIKKEVDYGEFIVGYVAAGAGITVVGQSHAKHLMHANVKAIPLNHRKAYRSVSVVSLSEAIGKVLFAYIK